MSGSGWYGFDSDGTPLPDPEPGMVANLDQSGAGVKSLMAAVVGEQVKFLVAHHRGDPDAARQAITGTVSRILAALDSDPGALVSAVLNFAASEAHDYVEHCGGFEKMLQNLASGVCQCGDPACLALPGG